MADDVFIPPVSARAQRVKKIQQAAETQERIEAAYRTVFAGGAADLVLRDLMSHCGFNPDTGIEADNLNMEAVIEGRKEVMRHILHYAGRRLTLSVTS